MSLGRFSALVGTLTAVVSTAASAPRSIGSSRAFEPTLGGVERKPWTGFPLPRAEGRLFRYAHRGASALATENTRAAFDKGYRDGADGAETDVQLTKDGVLVLFHDETTGRIAADGKNLRISESTWAELKDVKLKGGGSIMTLDELLGDFRQRYPGWKLNLELKTDLEGPHAEKKWHQTAGSSRAFGRKVAQALEEHPQLWPAVNLSSFNPHALKGLRDVNQTLPSALLHSPSAFYMYREKSLAQVANEVGAQGINVHVTSVLSGLYDPKAFAKLGFPTSCYTVDNPLAARRLEAKGCTGIFTNDPVRMGATPR